MKPRLGLWFLCNLSFVISMAATAASVKTYHYGKLSPAQDLDLYAPASAAPASGFPLLVFIHGGAWISGDKREYAALGEYFAGIGVSCAVINYRLSDSGDSIRHPSHVEDAARAIEWLRMHAREGGIDPAHIVVMGHSAGAHMTAFLGVNSRFLSSSNQIAGYIGLEGIYDLSRVAKSFPDYPNWFLNRAFGPWNQPKNNWAEASPQNAELKVNRPWLLVHSKADELVDLAQTQLFYEKLRQKSDDIDFALVDGKSHFEVVSQLTNPKDPVGEAIARFLKKISVLKN